MVGRTKAEHEEFLAKPAHERVNQIGHRNYVGGVSPETWYGIGRLQYHFLVSQGLRHDHRFLDVACGSLRLGQYLIPYLDEGCYMGLEGEPDLIEAGLQHELLFGLGHSKKPRFASNYVFDVSSLGAFDRAIAQSLFTHLTAEDIGKCFGELAKTAAPGAVFYATYFWGPMSRNHSDPSHAQKAWVYLPEEIGELAAPSGWKVTNIGNWGHPRHQLMLRCER